MSNDKNKTLADARKIVLKILDKNNPKKFNVVHPTRGIVEDLYFERQFGKRFCMLHTINNALGGEYVTYEAINPFIEKWTEEVLGPSFFTPEQLTEQKKRELKIMHGWNPAFTAKAGYELGETDEIVYDMTGDTMKEIVKKRVNRLYTTISVIAANAFLEHNYGITMRRVIALRDGVDYHYLLQTEIGPGPAGEHHAMAYRNGYILDSNFHPGNYSEYDAFAKGHTVPTTVFKPVTHYGGMETPYGEVYGAFQFFFVKQGETVPEMVSDFIDFIENPTPQQIQLGKNLWTKETFMRLLPKPFILHRDKFIINTKKEKHYMQGSFVTPAVRDYFTKKYGDREATAINLNDIPKLNPMYTHVLASPLDVSKLPSVSAEVDSKAIIRKYAYDEKKQKKKKYMLNAYPATVQNLEKAREDFTKYGYETLDFSDYQKTIDPIFNPVSKIQKFHMNFEADSDTEEEEEEEKIVFDIPTPKIPPKKTNNINWGKDEDWYDKNEEYDKYKNESIKKIPPLKKKNNVDVEDPFWDDFFAEEEEKAQPKKKIKVTFTRNK